MKTRVPGKYNNMSYHPIIKNLLRSESISETCDNVAHRYGIDSELIGGIKMYCAQILTGQIQENDYANKIAEETGAIDVTAKNIADEIIQKIVAPIRQYIKPFDAESENEMRKERFSEIGDSEEVVESPEEILAHIESQNSNSPLNLLSKVAEDKMSGPSVVLSKNEMSEASVALPKGDGKGTSVTINKQTETSQKNYRVDPYREPIG